MHRDRLLTRGYTCPAELREGDSLISSRKGAETCPAELRGAKKLWCARYDCRRPAPQNCWGLCAFAALQPAPQNYVSLPRRIAGRLIFSFLSRKGAETQRNCSPPLGSCLSAAADSCLSALDTWYFVLGTWYKSNLLPLASCF